MLIKKLVPALAVTFISACSTVPSHPIEANPTVTAMAGNGFEITVTGLADRRSLDVERGFHEVADEACVSKAGWSGWKMRDGAVITPVLASSGVYVAKGQVVCSQ